MILCISICIVSWLKMWVDSVFDGLSREVYSRLTSTLVKFTATVQPTTALCLPLQAALQWTGNTSADTTEGVQGQQASLHGERGAALEAAQWRPAGKSPPHVTHLTLQLPTELCLLPHNCAVIAQITPKTTTLILLITLSSLTKIEAVPSTEKDFSQSSVVGYYCWTLGV